MRDYDDGYFMTNNQIHTQYIFARSKKLLLTWCTI